MCWLWKAYPTTYFKIRSICLHPATLSKVVASVCRPPQIENSWNLASNTSSLSTLPLFPQMPLNIYAAVWRELLWWAPFAPVPSLSSPRAVCPNPAPAYHRGDRGYAWHNMHWDSAFWNYQIAQLPAVAIPAWGSIPAEHPCSTYDANAICVNLGIFSSTLSRNFACWTTRGTRPWPLRSVHHRNRDRVNRVRWVLHVIDRHWKHLSSRSALALAFGASNDTCSLWSTDQNSLRTLTFVLSTMNERTDPPSQLPAHVIVIVTSSKDLPLVFHCIADTSARRNGPVNRRATSFCNIITYFCFAPPSPIPTVQRNRSAL